MRAPTRSRVFAVVTLPLMALLGGCATSGTTSGQLTGTAHSIAWEVTDLRQRVAPNRQEIRWYYTIVLKETGGRAIEFETLERSAQGQLRVETAQTFPFTRRLAANSELRLYYWDGVYRMPDAASGFGELQRSPMSVFRRFRGKDDLGKRVTIDIRLVLDRGVGIEAPRPAEIELPPPTSLNQDDLRALAGTWRGYYRDASPFSIPLQLTITENGAFEGAVDEPVTSRFRANLAIRDGRLAYSRGSDTGTLTLHRRGDNRVLDGTITGSREGGQAGTTYPVSFTFRVRAVTIGSAGTPIGTAAPPSAQPVQSSPTTTRAAAAPVAQSDLLTNDGILAMVKAGIDENVILLKIKTAASAFDVRADALVQLKHAGVSGRILEAMITRASTKP